MEEGCKKDYASIDSNEIEGEYMFIEKFIYSYAKQISGHCDIGNSFLPHTIYSYDNDKQTLNYKLTPEFNINNNLKIIIGSTHVFAPLAGPYSTDMNLLPVYSLPDSSHGIYKFEDAIVEFDIKFKTIHERLTLPSDSSYIRVLKIIEDGIVEPSLGDSCVWEYTDSLVVTNYGFNPKSKITYQSMF